MVDFHGRLSKMTMIPGLDPPTPSQFYLLTDELASSGLFLLHRVLHHELVGGKSCLLVSFGEDFSYWNGIAMKQQIKLENYLASRHLFYIDGLSQAAGMHKKPLNPSEILVCPSLFSNERSLKQLFDLIAPILTSSPQILLVIDDLAILEWMGMSSKEIHRFLRALLHLIRKNMGSLLIRYRTLSLEVISEAKLFLLSHCHLHVEVLSLSSGLSSAVSGEIAIHAGPNSTVETSLTRSRDQALQYRLTEHGVVFFERGTSPNVL